MRNRFLDGRRIGRIAHKHALPGIDRYLGERERKRLRDVDRTNTVIVDRQVLFPIEGMAALSDEVQEEA